MSERRMPLYLSALVAILVGCVGFAVLGAIIGRGISAVGDPTAAAVVPVIVCAAFGYAVGGAFGCNLAMQQRNRSRASLGAAVVLIVLLLSLVVSGALSTSTPVPFFAFLPLGPLLASVLAVEITSPGQPRNLPE